MSGRLLAGRLAVITAAGAGIGRAIAERFVAEGADVVVTDRSAERVDAVVAALGPRARGVVADAASVADIERVYATVAESGRRVDVLVANAGTDQAARVEEMTEELFDAVCDVNFRGTYFTVQRALPVLADGASIILTSSIANANGAPGHAIYNATKAAVRSLARTLTAELAHRGIRVNAISPGPTETAGFTAFVGAGDSEMRRSVIAAIPVGRPGQPAEIAAAALFFASDQSSFVAGTELVVDGGMSQV